MEGPATDFAAAAPLEARDLAFERGGRRVVSGASFTVAAGEALLLRGPNGAGKSTLLRGLAGLSPPAAGSARLGGVAMGEDPEAYRGQLIHVGHLDAAKPVLTAAEQLSFWARYFNASADPASIARALDALGLAALHETPVGLMSAGQRRRLGLARLVAIPRALWLLDEPATALDASAGARLDALIADHRAAGGMVVAATHGELQPPNAEVLELSGLGPDPAADMAP